MPAANEMMEKRKVKRKVEPLLSFVSLNLGFREAEGDMDSLSERRLKIWMGLVFQSVMEEFYLGDLYRLDHREPFPNDWCCANCETNRATS